MAWRVYLAVLTATMLGLLAIAAMGASGETGFLVGMGATTLSLTPTMAGLLTLWLGPWLKRYYPFSQGLIFGAINIAALCVLAALLTVVETVLLGSSYGAFAVAMFYCPPAFVACAVGYQMAIWSITRRGTMVCWPILAVTIAVYAALSTRAWVESAI